MMSYFNQKHINFYFISCLNYKNYRRKVSLETVLNKCIYDFSVLRIIIMDGVTYVFNRDDTCIGDKLSNNPTLRLIE